MDHFYVRRLKYICTTCLTKDISILDRIYLVKDLHQQKETYFQYVNGARRKRELSNSLYTTTTYPVYSHIVRFGESKMYADHITTSKVRYKDCFR